MKRLMTSARRLCRFLLDTTLPTRYGTARAPRPRGFKLEPLETRMLLSVDLLGIPAWDDQGPTPTTGGQVQLAPNNPVTGSIQSVAAHPTNANIIFAGAENGGIWRTTDGGATWTALTDQYPSLAIGSLWQLPCIR